MKWMFGFLWAFLIFAPLFAEMPDAKDDARLIMSVVFLVGYAVLERIDRLTPTKGNQ